MRTKNAKAITTAEHLHLARVKALACSVCDQPGPSEAHHIKQGQHFSCVALCPNCHTGPLNGWHGQRRMWAIRKMDEVDALAVTIARLVSQEVGAIVIDFFKDERERDTVACKADFSRLFRGQPE